jgi:hypothetical protein
MDKGQLYPTNTRDIDALLDWRNRLIELKNEDKIYPKEWYDLEILATDFLLLKCVEYEANV